MNSPDTDATATPGHPRPPIKLFRWRQVVLPLAAAAGTLVYRMYQHWQQKGHLQAVDYWIYGTTFAVNVCIVAVVGWWANRPE